MSRFIPINIGDPEYYADLLSMIPRNANQRLLSNEHPCPDHDISGHDVDAPLSARLQTFLDVVADISLCQKKTVSATMASIRTNKDALETQLYIAFNHQDDGAARRCPEHLQSIFRMLHQVPYQTSADGSPTVITKDLEGKLVEICEAIHNYSFDIFDHRVNKRTHKLSEIQGYITSGSTPFTSEQQITLIRFFWQVERIIKFVTKARDTKQLPYDFIKTLLGTYWYWMDANLLPKDEIASHEVTLLDNVDAWLAKVHGIGFQLRRWATKIMSFVISANRLLTLTQSRRLRKNLEGNFSVQVLSSPTTTPYRCDLSSETMQMALDAALTEAKYHSTKLDEERASFMELLKVRDGVHKNPTVHAELALIIAMAKGKINDVESYIGVSKLSCIMCSHYIRAFNKVMDQVIDQKIATKGSHGKAYPGWF